MEKAKRALSLEQVARRLDEAAIPWAVFAGAAAAVYGADRPLTDIDILVPSSEGAAVATLFPGGEVRTLGEGELITALPGIDIVAGLGLMDLDAQMVARLVRHEIEGLAVPVIPAEDNLLLKAMWGRGPEVGKHDWEDVEAMMVHLPGLDWDYLRWRAATFDRPQRVRQAIERLEALWYQKGETAAGVGDER